MKAAHLLHFHIPVLLHDGIYYGPHYFSSWVNSFEPRVPRIGLIAYTDKARSEDEIRQLVPIQEDVRVIDLGVKKGFIRTLLNLPHLLAKVRAEVETGRWDYIWHRVPTVLSVYIYLFVTRRKLKNIFLFVSNMRRVLKNPHLKISFRQRFLLKFYWAIDHFFLERAARESFALFNGVGFFSEFNIENARCVFTSTISDDWIRTSPKQGSNGEIRLLYLGRTSADKGLPTLVEAVQHLRNQNNSIRLSLVGNEADLSNLIGQETTNAIPINYIQPSSQLEDLKGVYDQHDIFIIPSLVDFQPRTTWEALGRKLPVIVSKGVSSIAKQDSLAGTCFVFETGNSEALANLILTVSNMLIDDSIKNRCAQVASQKTIEESMDLMFMQLATLEQSNRHRWIGAC